MDAASKRTPLASVHESLGARMIDFGGWWMPVQYQGILEEHRAVREQAGLFDISHMGDIFVTGPASEAWLNRMLTNDVARLADGSREVGSPTRHTAVCGVMADSWKPDGSRQ